MNKYCNTLLFLISCTPIIAQPSFDANALKKQFPNATAIMLTREEIITISTQKEKVLIYDENKQSVLHIEHKYKGINNRSISYSPGFYEIDEIEACNYVPKEKGYEKFKVAEFIDEGNVGGNIFYDGIRYKKFIYPALGEGSITELKYNYNILDPSFLGGYFFQLGLPVVKQTYRVQVPKNIEVGYKFFGDSSHIKHTVKEEKGMLIHLWEAENLDELPSYDDAVEDTYFEPHIYVYIKSVKVNKYNSVAYFGSPELLFKHDRNFIANLNKDKPVSGLQKVLDSIDQISTDRESKIRNTYYWVQDHIRYIAFEDGLGGHVPRQANDVYLKNYGDCKDLSSLITFMLNHIGINAYMTWIGSRAKPYTYNELPLDFANNHMIASVFENGKWVFIDGTSEFTPYGIPSAFIQGKEAMIAISSDSFTIVTVPTMPPSANSSHDKILLHLEGTYLMGKGNLKLSGYNKSYNLSNLKYSGLDKSDDHFKGILSLGNNKCEILNYQTNNYIEKDSNLVIDYSFKLVDYVKEIDGELFVNLNLRRMYSDDKIDTSHQRIAPKELKYTYNDTSSYILEIPEHYKIKYLPTSKAFSTNHFKYSIAYTVINNKIIYTQTSSYDALTVEPADFEKWNEQILQITKSYKDLIILSKK